MVCARWDEIAGESALFVFCRAGWTPLAITTKEKRELGATIRHRYEDHPRT